MPYTPSVAFRQYEHDQVLWWTGVMLNLFGAPSTNCMFTGKVETM